MGRGYKIDTPFSRARLGRDKRSALNVGIVIFMDKLGFHPSWKTHTCQEVGGVTGPVGSTVRLAGWVHFIRDKGRLVFVHLRDSSGLCQLTAKEGVTPPATLAQLKTLTVESVVTVEGVVRSDERSHRGVEVQVTSFTTHSLATPKLPLDINGKVPFDSDTEFRFRELSVRTPKVTAIMRVKAEVAHATRRFFHSNGFTEIFTPYILATATEGGAAKFWVDYFGQQTTLAQSCQFYKQAAVQTHERVFGIIPSWRAEKSRTPKHVTEFHQIENEIAFASLDEILAVQERLIQTVVQHVKSSCAAELEFLGRPELTVPSLPFRRLTFAQAKEVLESELAIVELEEEDLSTAAETALSHLFTEPFFITHFPTHLRGMYYETDPTDESVTHSVDLVAPEGIGELSSGGQRVSSKDRLVDRILAAGLNPSAFEWYLRMFEYGFPPHAGYGLGFERLVRWICGLSHVREAVMFPRTPDLISP